MVKWNVLRIIKEHKQIGWVIFKLAQSDLIKTYRGAAIGWLWAIIKPTVLIFVYWFTFQIGLRAPAEVNGYPFFLWLIAGMIPWFFISEMITQGTSSIRTHRHLVTKMKFPVSTICTFVSISKIFVHLCLLSLVIIIFALFGFLPTIYYLQLPIYILFTFLLMDFWAILAAPLGAISRDFENLVKSFTSAIFWLSAIIWDPGNLTNSIYQWYFKLNPITYLANGYRDTLINKVWFFEKTETLYFLIALLLLALIASRLYNKLRKEIPDVL